MITGCQKVGLYRGSPIYRVTGLQFLCCNQKLGDFSSEEVRFLGLFCGDFMACCWSGSHDCVTQFCCRERMKLFTWACWKWRRLLLVSFSRTIRIWHTSKFVLCSPPFTWLVVCYVSKLAHGFLRCWMLSMAHWRLCSAQAAVEAGSKLHRLPLHQQVLKTTWKPMQLNWCCS